MRRFNPGLAFFLTSLIVAASLTVVSIYALFAPGATFDFGRDFGGILFAFVLSWMFTVGLGLLVGVPCWLGLRSLGMPQNLGTLASTGLIVGTLTTLVMGFIVSGHISFTEDPFFIGLGSVGGLVAGVTWWLLVDQDYGAIGGD